MVLSGIGYNQEATPIINDNSFVKSMVNDECKQKRAKAVDMRFHWLKDRVRQGQFDVRWCQGHTNISDYLTKDLPPHQFKAIRPIIFPGSARRSVTDLPNYKNKETSIDRKVKVDTEMRLCEGGVFYPD